MSDMNAGPKAAPVASGNEPVDCRAFCALIDDKRSVFKGKPTPLSLASWNAKEVTCRLNSKTITRF